VDSQTIAVLDPTTEVSVDRTVEVVQSISTSQLWGVIGKDPLNHPGCNADRCLRSRGHPTGAFINGENTGSL
jgi:hypothetical protein